MGSTFGKVRKYSLTPVDDSATPLKYSSVPEDKAEPTKCPPSSKLSLKENPISESKHPTLNPPDEPFQETTPNYSQLLPDHLRYNLADMYIPRTSSKVGHHFSTKDLEGSDSATSFKGPPVPPRNGINNGNAKSPFDSAAERRPKPEQKNYSADDIRKLLKQLRSRSTSQADVKLNDLQHYDKKGPLQSTGDEPCKYCRGFNTSKYRDQYILETDPPPYRPVSGINQAQLEEGSPLVYTPAGKHYHIVEVNPQPYFSSEDRVPIHNYGSYNVLHDPDRPNLMEPDSSDEVIANQTTNSIIQTTQERFQEPRPQNSIPARSKPIAAFHPKQQSVMRNRNPRLSHDTLYGSGSLGQPLTHNDFRTRSLPYRSVPHHCYTIPEENVTWPPPFHHSRSFHQVNRGGFRK